MAKRDRLNLGGGMTVETSKDGNGRFYVVYARGISVFMRNPKEVRKWLALPLKTTSRDAYDSWIASIEATDAERKGAKVESVGDANVEGSFDPLAHGLDESDPQFQTRTVI